MTSDKEQLRDISSIGMLLLVIFFRLLCYGILNITGATIGNQNLFQFVGISVDWISE